MFASSVSIATLLTAAAIGGGLPLGLPPGDEDPVMANIAPEECLAYVSWSGSAAPSADSENEFEQLLAEPEIQLVIKEVHRRITEAINEMGEGDPEGARMAKLGLAWSDRILSRPGAVFVSKAKISPDGPPDVAGGVIVTVGDESDELRELWESVRAALPVEEVEIGGTKMYQMQLGAKSPLLTFGIHGKYLVAGVGEGTVEGMVKRSTGEPPKWLRDLRKTLAVERPAIVSYINGGTIIEQVNDVLIGGPEGKAILSAIGIGNLSDLAAVQGLDDKGYVVRALIGFDGEPAGILGSAIGEPLKPSDLQPIPKDAIFAVAARLDAAKVFDSTLTQIERINPLQAEEFREMIGQMEESFGFGIRRDILGSLGDTFCIYHSPGEGGLIGGTAAVIQVKDHGRLKDVLDQILATARAAERLGAGDGPRLGRLAFNGQSIHYFTQMLDEDVPVSPAWCLTDDELIFSLFPQAVKAYLSRGDDYQSLAKVPAVAAAFQADQAPLKIVYQDTPKVFELAYPFVQIFAHFIMVELQEEGLDVDLSLLPSGSSIKKHLRPDVMTVTKTETGLEITSRQSAPISNLVTLLPLAGLGVIVGDPDPGYMLEELASLMVPEKAQESQAKNNLKQMALAMHGYHEVYAKFPPAVSTNDDGDSLLSWRVQILPFIEGGELYERFHHDEPWDSEHNKALIPLMPAIYRAPGSKQKPGMTNYLTIRSENSVFPGTVSTRMAQIVDGTSNTAMIVEVSDEKAVAWTKPEDLEIDPMKPQRGIVGLRRNGFLAAMSDGAVFKVTDKIAPETLRLIFDRRDGKPFDRSIFERGRSRRRSRTLRAVPDAIRDDAAPADAVPEAATEPADTDAGTDEGAAAAADSPRR